MEFGEMTFFIWLGLLLAIAGIIYYSFIKPGGLILCIRITVFILVIILLMQPVLLERKKTYNKPVLAVVIDNSQSMDVQDPVKRLNRVKEFIKTHIGSWRKKSEVLLYLFSGTTTRTTEKKVDSWKATGSATNIGHAVSEIGQELRGKLSSMIIISDGRDNGVINPAEAVQKLKVPVFTVGVGKTEQVKDMLISDLRAGDFAFKNTPLDITVLIRGYGFEGKKVPVRLYRQKELIATREITVPADGIDAEVRFKIIPKNIGTFIYRAAIPQYEHEASRKNNHVDFSIDVIREKLRILYICGQPGYEYALLREALKSDPAVELVSFVILRNPENIAFVRDTELSLIPFPAREIFLEKLFSFDLLIFENFTYVRFGIIAQYLENMRKFVVEKGGAFVMIGGQNSFGSGRYQHTPIEDILPLHINNEKDSFAIKPFLMRPRNLNHPIMSMEDDSSKNRETWNNLPSLVGFNTHVKLKKGAVILGEHPWEKNESGPVPVLAVWQKGKGRVMAITSNTTWRWAMGLARQGKTAFGYNRFWRKAVRWLTQAEEMKLVLLTFDKRRFDPGETMRIKIMVKDEAYDPFSDARIVLHVFDPNGIKKSIQCFAGAQGEFHAEYEPWDVGTYRFTVEAYNNKHNTFLGKDIRKVDVHTFSKEKVELNMNEKLLSDMALLSGGVYSSIETFEDKKLFKSLTVRERGEITGKNLIWNHPLLFGLIMLLLIVEWFFRRRKGMA